MPPRQFLYSVYIRNEERMTNEDRCVCLSVW